MIFVLIALWLAGTYGLWKLFEASCAADESEPMWLAFAVVSFWPLVVPIVLAQDLWDCFREWRNARV